MNAENALNSDVLNGLRFVGLALAPFFLEDPETGNAQRSFEALSLFDSEELPEWPFVESVQAQKYLMLMKGEAESRNRTGMAREYRRLLIGPKVKPAPPWGSVYMDKDGVVFGVSEIRLKDWMRENGVKRLSSETVPEDHIGLMLAQMASLAEHRADIVVDYMKNHLLTWSHHFFTIFCRSTEHPFYHSLGKLTDASLEGFRIQSDICIEYPRYYRH